MTTTTITREQLANEVTEHWLVIQRHLAVAFHILGVRDPEECISEASFRFWTRFQHVSETNPEWSVQLRVYWARRNAVQRTFRALCGRASELVDGEIPEQLADYRSSEVRRDDGALEMMIALLPPEYRQLAAMLAEGLTQRAIAERWGLASRSDRRTPVQRRVNRLREWLEQHPDTIATMFDLAS